MKKIYCTLLYLLFFAFGLYSQDYSETFAVPNKGILSGPCTGTDGTTCLSHDFSGVNWTIEGNLSGIDEEAFATNASNQLVVTDIDEEACWVSPVLNIVNAPASFAVDLSWLGYDPLADYIDVEYTLDGSDNWVTLPNLIGGGPNHTVEYAAGTGIDGSTTISNSNLIGSTLQIRICTDHNSAEETTTISKVLAFGAEVAEMNNGSATIEVTAPCLGATFTFILDETESPDASGRNVYFHPQTSIEIQFNTELERWEIRARGGNFDVYYHNDFASSPNPPDNMTAPWEDNAICDGTGLPTVTGDGTQNSLGEDPCTDLGGDTDEDGVCDDNDRCPGSDDNMDQDNDGIPDACDDNPTVADGVLVQAPCLDDDLPILLLVDRVDETGRNVYINETYQIEVRYDAELGRWEVTAEEPGTDVYFYNEFASFPDPPASNDYPWTATGSLCSGSTVSVSGTGTQTVSGCTMFILFEDIIETPPTCPGGTDGAFSVTAQEAKGPIFYSLDGMVSPDGNFTGLASGNYTLIVRDSAFPESSINICQISTLIFISDGVDNELPTITCPEPITVNTDAGMCTATVNYTAPAGMDNCSVESTLLKAGLGTGAAFPLGMTTETYEVTDAGGNVAECSFTVTVEDTEAPTAVCNLTTTVQLDTVGMGLLTVDAVNAGSVDACGEVTFSLDRDTFSCDDLNAEIMVTLTVTDAVGQSNTCTSTVTVEDTQGFCASVPVRNLFGASALERLPVAPNPAREGVQVDLSRFTFSGGQRILLSLFNSTGQEVGSFETSHSVGRSFYLETATFPAGIYFLRLQENGRPRAAARLVIQ